MNDPCVAFAEGLLQRGIEVVLRGNRLHVWPGKAYKHLTDAEREFINVNRDALKELARSHALPETTVVWQQPPTPTPTPTATQPESCPYCWGTCVGTSHEFYKTFHFLDPREVERRNAAATRLMMHQVGR
jgi:hypothetical protein